MVSEIMGHGFILIVFLLISLILFVLSFKHKTLGYKLLSLSCFLVVLLFLGEAYQIFSVNVFNKLFGLAIANIDYALIPVVALAFALYFSNNNKYLNYKYFIPISIIPIFSAIGGFINCFIPIFNVITILPSGLIECNFTMLYNAIDLYLTLLSLIILIIVVIELFKDKKNWKQYVLFIAAILAPTFMGFLPLGREFLPISYFLSLLFFWWAVLGYNILDFNVIHQEFMDYANIGMLAFDAENRLIEVNSFSKHVLGILEKDIEKPVEKVFKDDPEFLEFYFSDEDEIKFFTEKHNRWFKINKNIVAKDNKIIGYLFVFEDITEDTLKTQNLEVLNSVMLDVESSTLLSINYQDNKGIYHWSDEAYQILEREPRSNDKNIDIFVDAAIGYEQTDFDEDIDSLTSDAVVTRDFKIKTESGKIKYLTGTLHKIYDNNGNFLRLSMSAQDVTEQTEDKLALAKSADEKTVLLKEIHHRVKNNLQLMSSFINLEQKFHSDDPERIIDVTKDRINALALVHERIYNEENMENITIVEFFNDFDKKLFVFSSQKDIKFVSEIPEDLILPVDTVTPLTLMINELTLNTFKYAFDDSDEDKTIYKSFNVLEKEEGTFCRFEYKDNGKGLPKDLDVTRSKSLGWKIIISLSGQLDGEYEIINDNGFGFVLTFPIN